MTHTKMNNTLYRLLILPLRVLLFFRYGIPYCYLKRHLVIDKNNKDKIKYYYHLAWYFNDNGERDTKTSLYVKKKLTRYNYPSQKYLGNKLSLKISYTQLFKLYLK